jgi:hypothetical protein
MAGGTAQPKIAPSPFFSFLTKLSESRLPSKGACFFQEKIAAVALEWPYAVWLAGESPPRSERNVKKSVLTDKKASKYQSLILVICKRRQ